jgi:MFS family permease
MRDDLVGSPFFGWFSSRIGKRRIFLQICGLLGFVVSLIVLYVPGVPFSWMLVLLFAFGIATSGHILTFALAKEAQSTQVTATVIGFNNMAVVAGGAIFQPLVGFILHSVWGGEIVGGIPAYTVGNYQAALFVVPLSYLVGWIVSQFFIKETLK